MDQDRSPGYLAVCLNASVEGEHWPGILRDTVVWPGGEVEVSHLSHVTLSH